MERTLAALSLAAAIPLAAACASSRAAAPAPGEVRPAAEGRRIELSVTDEGFVPDEVRVERGEPVTLVVTRRTDRTCATEIMIPDLDIVRDLPLDEPVEVSFTPERSGRLKFGCGMGQMIGGVILVE